VLDAATQTCPRLDVRMRDETGALRRHVNVFVNGEDVRRGAGLETPVDAGAVVHVLPAVSGG
jgi:molybdopterin converting factor small subunit